MTYPVTPTLSVDGNQERSISFGLTATARRPVGAVGASLSVAGAKVAVTARAALTGTLHFTARPQSERDQLVSSEPFVEIAVSVTLRPSRTEALQSVGQAIPGPRIEPVPL